MHHTLLPQKTVKELKIEYRVRLLIVALFFISISVLISSVFLFPSYIISSLAERETSAKAKDAANGTSTDITAMSTQLSAAQSLVSSISSSLQPPLSEIILHLSAIRPRGISITSFDVAYTGDGISTVSITGTAPTRNDLVIFREIVEADKNFTNVEIPISDLAPSSHLQFSMHMSAAMEKPSQ